MLTAREAAALRNLADKKTGTITAFVKIADARRLTELGLARRSQQGWDITAEGSAYLAAIAPDHGCTGLEPEAVIEASAQNGGADEQAGEARPANSED